MGTSYLSSQMFDEAEDDGDDAEDANDAEVAAENEDEEEDKKAGVRPFKFVNELNEASCGDNECASREEYVP